jgi:hypothetical protein
LQPVAPQPAKANTLRIEGTVVMFIFIDPRSFVILTDKDGAKWTVEWASAQSLRRQGVELTVSSQGITSQFLETQT